MHSHFDSRSYGIIAMLCMAMACGTSCAKMHSWRGRDLTYDEFIRRTTENEICYLRVIVPWPHSLDGDISKHVNSMDVILVVPYEERELIRRVLAQDGRWTGEGDTSIALCGDDASFQFQGDGGDIERALWVHCSDVGMIFGMQRDMGKGSGLFENDELLEWFACQLERINLPGHATLLRSRLHTRVGHSASNVVSTLSGSSD